MGYSFSSLGNATNERIITAHTNITDERWWAFHQTSPICRLVLGCPTASPAVYDNGSYIDILSSPWTCFKVAPTDANSIAKAILVKTTGQNKTACLSPESEKCLELDPLCCDMWSKTYPPIPLTAPLVTCSGGSEDPAWCDIARKTLANASLSYYPI